MAVGGCRSRDQLRTRCTGPTHTTPTTSLPYSPAVEATMMLSVSASRRTGTAVVCIARQHFASNTTSSAVLAAATESSGAAKQKIPPHVTAELRRHVAASKAQARGNASSGDSAKAGKEGGGGWSKGATLAACCAFTAAAGSIPYLVMKHFKPLNEREEALTHAQIRRGAFMNSGSRDVGKDPMWDFKTGTRIQDKGYVELFEKDEGPDHVDHDDKVVAAARRR